MVNNMESIKWKDENQLYNHFKKHVLGYNNINIYEPKLWEDSFKLYSNDELQKHDKYRDISIDNLNSNNYLCKDKISNDFSINYYSIHDDNYLLTCTKLKNNNRAIYSCYFTNDIHVFLDIYLFTNNIVKKDKYKYIAKNFTKYEREESKFDKYCRKAYIISNLNNPKYTATEEITIFQMNILIAFLKDESYCKTNQNVIWINKLLLERLISIRDGKDIEWNQEKNNQIISIYNEISNMYKNEEFYKENEDAVDLLIEINNIINKDYEIVPNINSRWKEMFDRFKNWNIK